MRSTPSHLNPIDMNSISVPIATTSLVALHTCNWNSQFAGYYSGDPTGTSKCCSMGGHGSYGALCVHRQPPLEGEFHGSEYSYGAGIECCHSGKVSTDPTLYETTGSVHCRSHGTVLGSKKHEKECVLGPRPNGDQCIGCAVSPNGWLGQAGEVKCLYLTADGRIERK